MSWGLAWWFRVLGEPRLCALAGMRLSRRRRSLPRRLRLGFCFVRFLVPVLAHCVCPAPRHTSRLWGEGLRSWSFCVQCVFPFWPPMRQTHYHAQPCSMQHEHPRTAITTKGDPWAVATFFAVDGRGFRARYSSPS